LSPDGPEPRGHSFVDRVGVFFATCSYIGYAPVAPGTFGSAAGLAVFAAVRASGSTFVEVAVIAGSSRSASGARQPLNAILPASILLPW
jgi:hypothetical protein